MKKIIWAALAAAVVFTAASAIPGCVTGTIQETKPAQETKPGADSAEGKTTAEGADFNGKSLVISGSTTLLEVSEAWADAFMTGYGGEITVNGGGSGVGIADMINGTNDIANSSRKIKDEEAEQAEAAGIDVKEYTVLYDGIVIITSKNIVVAELTVSQLSDIYTGKITNWKDVGGADKDIVAVARDSASGTGEYFLEEIVQLGKTMEDNDYADIVLRLQSNADVANQVSGNDNCIGFIGLGYVDSVTGKANVAKVREDGAGEAIEPNLTTVGDKSYPIARDLFVYADGNRMSDFTIAFVDFIFSEKGQAIGNELGFVAVK